MKKRTRDSFRCLNSDLWGKREDNFEVKGQKLTGQKIKSEVMNLKDNNLLS